MTKNQNYYKQLYSRFIKSRRHLIRDGYIERHHIKPRGIGGSDSSSNLINLTPREHFFAHLILYKIYPTNLKIVKGLSAMACGDSKKLNSWQYAAIKRAITRQIPPKVDLENLYYSKNMSYKKIGDLYKVSDMTVCKWFKIYNMNTGKMRKDNNKYKFVYDQTKIVELYNSGKYKAIQEYYNVSFSLAFEWAKKCNLTPVQTIGVTKPVPDRDKLYEIYFKGYTIKNMSKMFNVSMSLMRQWIKQYKFEPRVRATRSYS